MRHVEIVYVQLGGSIHDSLVIHDQVVHHGDLVVRIATEQHLVNVLLLDAQFLVERRVDVRTRLDERLPNG